MEVYKREIQVFKIVFYAVWLASGVVWIAFKLYPNMEHKDLAMFVFVWAIFAYNVYAFLFEKFMILFAPRVGGISGSPDNMTTASSVLRVFQFYLGIFIHPLPLSWFWGYL